MLFTRTNHHFPDTDKKQVKITGKTNIYHFYRILFWISCIEILLIDFFLEDKWSNMQNTFGLLKEVFFEKRMTNSQGKYCTPFEVLSCYLTVRKVMICPKIVSGKLHFLRKFNIVSTWLKMHAVGRSATVRQS